jgi:hypothetical protein
MDTERLDNEHFRERFLLRVDEERSRLAQHYKHLRQNAYKGHFCAVKETNNRHIFYGSFLYVWDCLVTKNERLLRYDHAIQFVTFVSIENHSSALCVDIVSDLAMKEDKLSEVESALYNPSPSAFFELLEMEYQAREETHPFSIPSSRTRNIDGPVYSGPVDHWKASLHVRFVKHCLDLINLADSKEGQPGKGELEDAFQLIVSSEARSASHLWGPHELKELECGRVHVSILIQLAAFMMIIRAKHAGYAYIEKGNSGFYKCVKNHKRRSYGEDYHLSTEDAQREVEIILGSLESKGYRVSKAWLQQNGSRCWREKRERLKNDYLFWDKEN